MLKIFIKYRVEKANDMTIFTLLTGVTDHVTLKITRYKRTLPSSSAVPMKISQTETH